MWGLGDAEALRRTGAIEESIRPISYEALNDEGLFPDTISAGRLGGWTVLIERGGRQAMERDALRAPSAATEVVSVLRHDHGTHNFVYVRHGETATSFNPTIPAWRYG